MVDAAWLIPAFPLVGFLALVFGGRRLGDPRAGWLATAAIVGSFLATLVTFAGLVGLEADQRSFNQTLFSWVPSGGLEVSFGFLVDPLSVTMALFVTGVGSLIHLYAIGYMHGDSRYHQFFVYLNLFAFSMLMLVMADNFLLTFLGWEGVGACSYFLISFWFERSSAATAGKKAFVTNRIGDFGFMLAMFLIFATVGTLSYTEVMGQASAISEVTAGAIVLLLFLGAIGKSAQLPLYVWLPDAMEGPTPVSALIHAATMVTAGVFLMVRSNPLLHAATEVSDLIAIVGAVTALFAATVACAQSDIKKVLAYSTVSQLGYMFLAVGTGAYVAAIFHMITHAFFKALLFLGAGSVIHGLHDEQDMNRMGALRKWMPVTSATFIVGWLAIAGVFPFAGFWSKDDILLAAWDSSKLLWAIGLVTALLTAYYMSRQVFMVFYGQANWSSAAGQHGAHGDAGQHGAHGDTGQPHESPRTMTTPLVVLAGAAGIAGVINLPFDGWHHLADWLEPVVGHHEIGVSDGTKVALALSTMALALVGIAVAARIYHQGKGRRVEPRVLANAWYVDDFYAAGIAEPGREFAQWSADVVDQKVIDGAVNGVGRFFRGMGGLLRLLQTGYVRSYALAIGLGTVAMLAYFLSRAT